MKSPLPFFSWPLYKRSPLAVFVRKTISIEKVLPAPSKRGNCRKLEALNSGVDRSEAFSKYSQFSPFLPGGHLHTSLPGPIESQTDPTLQGLERQEFCGVSQKSPVYSVVHSQRNNIESNASHVPPFWQGSLMHGLSPHSCIPSVCITVSSLNSNGRLPIFSLRMQPRKPLSVPMFSNTLEGHPRLCLSLYRSVFTWCGLWVCNR